MTIDEQVAEDMRKINTANRLIDYQKDLLEELKDRDIAIGYLDAAHQDEDPRIFILALENTLAAQKSGVQK